VAKSEFCSSIILTRAVEDSIRATKKYTKGAFRKSVDHPMQGNGFPSKVLTEYYEVYPSLEIGWDMRATDAWAWVWGDIPHIDVLFHYDYIQNKAKIVVHGGNGAVKELAKGIPDFSEALAKAIVNGRGTP